MINPAQPNSRDILDQNDRNTRFSTNCVQLGVVQSFDPATQLSTVKIAMKQVTNIAADGTKTLKEYPLLMECPTFVLNGGGDFLSVPISEGDNCIVLFNDRDIDSWLISGDGSSPTTARIHDLSDGLVIVGVNPLTNAISDFLDNGIRLSHNNGNTKIDLIDDLIEATAVLVRVNGGLNITGTVTGDVGGNINFDTDLTQTAGKEIHAGNGATGTFTTVTVVDGIVTGGS